MNTELDKARADLKARQGKGARYDAASAPARELDWARRGSAYLARIMGNLSDPELDGPSAVAGRSRRHLIAFASYQARLLAEAIAFVRGAPGGQMPASMQVDTGLVDLGATLPAQALRHLARHATVHLDVEWRDTSDTDWTKRIVAADGSNIAIADTPMLRSATVWRIAVELNAGGRVADAPVELRSSIVADSQTN